MPHFKLTVQCDCTSWGENVAVLGAWNSWDKKHPTILTTSPRDYPAWRAAVSFPEAQIGRPIEYKYAIVRDDAIVRWESSSTANRSIIASKSAAATNDVFGRIPHRLPSSLDTISLPDLASQKLWAPAPHSPTSPPPSDAATALDPLERAVVRHTADHRSWRQRLSFVRSLFTDRDVAADAKFDRTSINALATVAVYVNFLSTGQVRCDEDGGHHRPNHHAHEARHIDAALAKLIYDVRDAPSTSRDAYLPCVARKIFPHLPSYSSQFTVSVPLTRIRDIAHRNDIPKEVKLDIKHNLQNKLHRCAGPEDLHTSARILGKISHGGYSHPFVEQFRIFHAELLAFFNASSLDDRLRYLAHNEHTRPTVSLANQLLADKHSSASSEFQLDTVTALRQVIANLPLMKPPVHQSDLPSEDVQKTRLADIDLENYAFVLLAAEAKVAEEGQRRFPWPRMLKALSQAMLQIALSGTRPLESFAVAAELGAVSTEMRSTNPMNGELQRARAAVDRALRFAHEFSAALTEVYERRVTSLGSALGVEHHAISVFAEAEIRSAIAFQASRLADAGARAARSALSLPPWDPLFEGVARGELVFTEELDRTPSGRGSNVIVIARHADGDEDIPDYVKGVVLGRTLPHLSHLGVRARQAGVVFVCAEERSVFDRIWEAGGRGMHELTVNSRDGLSSLGRIHAQKGSPNSSSSSVNGRVAKAVRKLTSKEISFDETAKSVLPLGRTTKHNVSSKAAFAGRLATLADESDGLFETPKGVALPHGVFQLELRRNAKEYAALISSYNASLSQGEEATTVAAERASAFIQMHMEISDAIVAGIQNAFSGEARVMVRSSANAEDLESMSGAGLYDSVANVIVGDGAALRVAVGRVWASLWTKRAASSRASYDVPHAQVSMAVLVQKMVHAELSFVAFSRDPVAKGGGADDVYIEMAVGMGETLASATTDGNPYRFRVRRDSLDVEVIAMASYADALVPNEKGGGKGDGLNKKVVDYSRERLTNDATFREEVVQRVAKTVMKIEDSFGGPQDVEGAVGMDGERVGVFVVQARPQIL